MYWVIGIAIRSRLVKSMKSGLDGTEKRLAIAAISHAALRSAYRRAAPSPPPPSGRSKLWIVDTDHVGAPTKTRLRQSRTSPSPACKSGRPSTHVPTRTDEEGGRQQRCWHTRRQFS